MMKKLNKILLLDELESPEFLICVPEKDYEGELINQVIGNQGIIISNNTFPKFQHIQCFANYLNKNRIKVRFEKGYIHLFLVVNFYDNE